MGYFFEGSQGQALRELAETLWNQGFKVYLAGGCVRDHLLGRKAKDLDVVTDATVEDVQSLFAKTIPVGAQFGIVRVLLRGHEFEVARFRTDGPYRDGRHPEFVKFASPEEDAARRDFTVNALFYDLKTEQIFDFVNGRVDLQNRLLRAVGDPFLRFAEDHLRILRLLRFSCQLDFGIEPETAKAAESMLSHLSEVSGERLCAEITKALASNPRKALEGFAAWQLPRHLFPEWTLTSLHLCPVPAKDNIGWLLTMWILSFQGEICEQALVVESSTSWRYNKIYGDTIEQMGGRFKLSREDSKVLRELSAVLAWGRVWTQIREGLRASLAQSESFSQLLEMALALGAWGSNQISEVQRWQEQPRLEPWLSGKDVLVVPPEERGLVLKESLYLQYEGTLTSRSAALDWLRGRYQK